MSDKLTSKQEKQYRLFAQKYIIKFNATEAAIQAGYSEKTAKQQGSRLLTYVDVQRFMQEYIKEREKRISFPSSSISLFLPSIPSIINLAGIIIL